MARAQSIEDPLRASRNTSRTHWAHQQGIESEQAVIRYYTENDFEFLAQRLRTPFAEVDLLFRAPENHLVMVEVKTSNLVEFQSYRISRRQKERLFRALTFLSSQLDSLIEIHWAFVTNSGEITVIEDISG